MSNWSQGSYKNGFLNGISQMVHINTFLAQVSFSYDLFSVLDSHKAYNKQNKNTKTTKHGTLIKNTRSMHRNTRS